jgi:hypothetical protein
MSPSYLSHENERAPSASSAAQGLKTPQGWPVCRKSHLAFVFCFSAARNLIISSGQPHLRAAEKQETGNKQGCGPYYKQATPLGFLRRKIRASSTFAVISGAGIDIIPR